ncbi:MAG: pantoate--beta-alanine ligase [Actinobacteria bacterium]|nr:pantoate--beta-alanine ligase [Actinomycetota bacterium]
MRRIVAVAELRTAIATARLDGRRVALVPTMGALHAGHLALVEAACPAADLVVVSIFVNPLQFAPGEDLDAYPRDLEGDEAQLASLGGHCPDLVFAPTVEEVYPRPVRTTVSVAGLTEGLCGASRPGHFDGVTTVVAKLFNLVQPDVAFFGRKDFQQLQVIRRMVADLDVPVEVVGVPTVRESDGLARSSRNAYLDDDERAAATTISRGLREAVLAAREARDAGRSPDPDVLREVVSDTLASNPSVRSEYVEVVDPDTLQPPDGDRQEGDREEAQRTATGSWLVAVAAYVGRARLIDNVVVGDESDEEHLLAATS